jgi:ATP-binding cassette, subfamily F, member 3
MLELTADRLVLVDAGSANEYSGSIEDYTDMILGKNQPKGDGGSANSSFKSGNKKEDRKAAAQAREAQQVLRKAVRDAEADLAKLSAVRSMIDVAMFDPKTAAPEYASLTMSELSQRRGKLSTAIDVAEAKWLEANEALEKQ